jgi:hypothetical protein
MKIKQRLLKWLAKDYISDIKSEYSRYTFAAKSQVENMGKLMEKERERHRKERLQLWDKIDLLEENLKHFTDVLIAVEPDNFLTIENGHLKLAGEPLTDQQKKILREEAVYYKGTDLYKVFQNTLTETARQKMFDKAKSWEDMTYGKALLYNLDVEKKIIEMLSK